jgi:hypothetical protein
LSIILADRTTPALSPQNANPTPANQGLISTSGGTTLYAPVPTQIVNGLLVPITNPATNQAYTPTTLAGKFNTHDQILFVKGCAGGAHPQTGSSTTNSNGCRFTTALLSGPGVPSTSTPPGNNFIVLTFNSTQPGGSNTILNDPLNLTTETPAALLTDTYGPSDFVVRLSPITYSVNAANPNDPQLVRTQANVPAVVMDQVIAFKVGASIWNNASSTSSFSYDYQNATYGCEYNLIRSIRISMIGRTAPDPTNPYRNQFDNGQYQLRGNSIIVNPRNLSMNQD